MRFLFILAVLAILGLIVTGAIKLQRSSDDTISIQIDKTQVKEDAKRVLREGRTVIREATSALRDFEQEGERK